jgi:hypothetical protein
MKHKKAMFTLKSTVERREAKEARLQAIESRLEQLSVKESSQEIDNTNFVKIEEFDKRIEANERTVCDLSGVVSAILRDDSLLKRIEALEQRENANADQTRIHELETQVKELREQNHALETRVNELSRRSFAIGASPVTPIGFTFGSGLARTSSKLSQKSAEQKEKEKEKEIKEVTTEG